MESDAREMKETFIPLKQNTEENNQLTITFLNENTTNYEDSIKVILLGESNVGKTSIAKRLKNNSFDEKQNPTLSLELYNLVLKINSYILRLQIWDTAGQEKFDSISSNYYTSTDAAIFIYSINNINSFNKILNWLNQLENKVNSKDRLMVKILIGNKSDLVDERVVSYEMGENFVKENKFTFFKEISCKEKNDKNNNENIKSIFETIGKLFYEYSLNNKERLNSSSFNYKASSSMLQNKPSKHTNKKEKKKSCNC